MWWESLHLSWAHNADMPLVNAQYGGTASFSIGPAAHRAVEKGCDLSNLGRSQYGGTASFRIGPAAHRAVEKGCDPTNLARWTWTRYRGKNNQTLWVTTAYRPNHPNGPFAVYA